MERRAITPRPNLDARCHAMGFAFATIDGEPYWDERVHYAFTLDQIERDLEDPTAELHRLCLAAAERIIGDEALMRRLAVPERAWPLIRASWTAGEPSLYGRFDFSYDGRGPAKLLEYNADTPTALFEASVFQWQWLEDLAGAGVLAAGCDQFNALHERLVARFTEIAAWHRVSALHFACDVTSQEDKGCVAYLADCAAQAGLTPTLLGIGQIGVASRRPPGDAGPQDGEPFVDMENRPIALLFKLYPWEWMFADQFAQTPSMQWTRFIEPPWKAVLSNKGLLPVLWEMAPGHPNLLEAYFADDPQAARLGDRYAEKPLYSREGSGIRLVEGMFAQGSADGPYAGCPRIRQALAPLPLFDGNHPVIGSWLIGAQPAGIGIREDISAITTNASRFVPHIITPSP